MTTVAAINTINPYTPSAEKPWNAGRVRHVFNRLGFGASLAQTEAGLDMTPAELIDDLLDSVVNAADPVPPYWSEYSTDDYDEQPNEDLVFIHKEEFAGRWIREMMESDTAVRAKIALFWHNHFVTQEEIYFCNSFMWSYYDLLHKQALGNFRTFTEEMGIEPAMLAYLNGTQNFADEPNENYARELMELFTMGENNGYTQNDVEEVARALTGWQINYNCGPDVYFIPDYHDDGQKTIFGQTGNWNYEDVHELIFTLRATQTAHYICEKIYKHFVHDEADEAIVSAMAATFQENNWELAPVFRQLFKSEHFFESRFINAKIKSPFEVFTTLTHALGAEGEDEITADAAYTTAFYAFRLGQYIFNPVDVAGWPGQRAWLNENTMTNRWNFGTNFLYGFMGESDTVREKMRQLAIDLTAVDETDPEVVTAALAAHFLNTELDPANLQAATSYFIGEVPLNYFEDGTWSLYYNEVPDQIMNLLYYMLRLPEWQLS